MTTAGYSGTPLPQKLGVKAGARLLVVDAPDGFDLTLGELPPDVQRLSADAHPVDVLIAFYTSQAALRETYQVLAKR